MVESLSLGERWRGYRPSKTALFWCCAGSVALTILVGFTWGGWVGGGTAARMAEKAAQDTRLELAASLCVDRFMAAADADAQLASLQSETSARKRADLIAKGGWVTLPGTDKPVAKAGEICAQQLLGKAKPPA